MTDYSIDLINKRRISEEYVLNTIVKVGFLPNEFDNFYFENYLRSHPFFNDIEVNGINVSKDRQSLLHEKILEIKLKQKHYYTKVIEHLRDKLIRGEHHIHLFIEPYYN